MMKDLYSAENQLVKALPKMLGAATAPKLKAGFKKHLAQTKQHVSRLEQIFKGMEEGPHGKHCLGMEGLIKEGQEAISEDPGDEELDAALICRGAARRALRNGRIRMRQNVGPTTRRKCRLQDSR
jgi:ferritin-like metal-binding protein YciE